MMWFFVLTSVLIICITCIACFIISYYKNKKVELDKEGIVTEYKQFHYSTTKWNVKQCMEILSHHNINDRLQYEFVPINESSGIITFKDIYYNTLLKGSVGANINAKYQINFSQEGEKVNISAVYLDDESIMKPLYAHTQEYHHFLLNKFS